MPLFATFDDGVKALAAASKVYEEARRTLEKAEQARDQAKRDWDKVQSYWSEFVKERIVAYHGER